MGEQLRGVGRIHPHLLEVVVGLHRPVEDRPIGRDDQAARPGVVAQEHADVVRVVLEAVRAHDLEVRELRDEPDEQDHHTDADAPDRGVHAATTLSAGTSPAIRAREVSSETRSRSASATKFATSDDPPYEMNGSVMPVSGMTRVTPPRMMKLCSPMIVASPAAKSFENARTASAATRKALPTKSMNPMTTLTVPMRPSSSPIAENTKSVAALGILSGFPRPSPVPAKPPVPNAYHDWMIWNPVVDRVFHGLIHVSTRTCTCPNSWYAMNAPMRKSTSPTSRYHERPVAM